MLQNVPKLFKILKLGILSCPPSFHLYRPSRKLRQYAGACLTESSFLNKNDLEEKESWTQILFGPTFCWSSKNVLLPKTGIPLNCLWLLFEMQQQKILWEKLPKIIWTNDGWATIFFKPPRTQKINLTGFSVEVVFGKVSKSDIEQVVMNNLANDKWVIWLLNFM